MIDFSNAKINLGLHIKWKRDDGFHELETVFYPIPLTDVIEIVPHNELVIEQSGEFSVDCPTADNLIYKAWKILHKQYQIKPSRFILHKNIPSGAGLGGGSSNAAFTLKILNEIHDLKIENDNLESLAAQIGSDCAFFIQNKPSIASGRGEVLNQIKFSLKGKYLQLIIPNVHISTAEAYGGIVPKEPENNLIEVLKQPNSWKQSLKNDFEDHIFKKYPQLQNIKNTLYDSGAEYAAMSGSGSSMFGIFDKKPDLLNFSNVRLQKIFQL